MSTTVKVLSAKKVVANHQVNKGELLVIEARDKSNYQLIDNNTGFGPQNIIAKREGKDLAIFLEDGDASADILIKGYYGDENSEETSNLIVGQHETGGIYAYVPESGEKADAVSMLKDQDAEPQALGGDELVTPFWVFNPWWLLALLPLAALAFMGGGSGKKGGDAAPADTTAPSAPKVVANKDGSVTVTPPADADTKSVTIKYVDENGNPQTIVATKDDNGKWTVPANNDGITVDDNGNIVIPATAVKDGSEVVATAEDNAGNVSDEGKDTVYRNPGDSNGDGNADGADDSKNQVKIPRPEKDKSASPEVTANDDGSVDIKLPEDVKPGTKVDVTFTTPGGTPVTVTLEKKEDGSWASSDPDLIPDVPAGQNVAKINEDKVEDNTPVTAISQEPGKDPSQPSTDVAKAPAQDDVVPPANDSNTPEIVFAEDKNDDDKLNKNEVGDDNQTPVHVSIPKGANPEVGDIVKVVVNGEEKPVTLTQDDLDRGYVTVDVPVTPDTKEIKVDAVLTDPNGTPKSEENSRTIAVDVVPPSDPDVIAEDDGSVTIKLPTDAEPGDTAKITLTPEGGKEPVTVELVKQPDGSWTSNNPDLIPDVPAGEDAKIPEENVATDTPVTAIVVDPAGNTSNPDSDTVKGPIEVPRNTDGAPNIIFAEDKNGDGYINKDELDDVDGSDTTPVYITIPDNTEVGDKVVVTVNGQPVEVPALTDADITKGYIKVDVPVTEKVQPIEVTAKVEAGNGKGESQPATAKATVDTREPGDIDDNGNKDNTDDSKPNADKDPSEPQNPVIDGKEYPRTVDGAPNVFFPEDKNGDNKLNAKEVGDDKSTPVAVGIPENAQPGDVVQVTINGEPQTPVVLDQATIDKGYVEFPVSTENLPKDDNGKDVIDVTDAKVVTPAGNESNPGSGNAIVDTGVPGDADKDGKADGNDNPSDTATLPNGKTVPTTKDGAPNIIFGEDADENGTLNADEIGTDKSTPIYVTIPVGTEEGDTLVVTINGEEKEIPVTAQMVTDKFATIDQPVTPETKEIAVTAKVVDDAGNESAQAEEKVAVDYKTPGDTDGDGKSDVGPVLEIPEAENGVNAKELEDGIQAKVTPPKGSEPGDTIVVELKDKDGNPVKDADGNPITVEKEIPAGWTEGTPVDVTIPKDVLPKDADGKPVNTTYKPTAKVVDDAGNTSKDSNPVDVKLDTKGPGDVNDDGKADNGDNDNTTENGAPKITFAEDTKDPVGKLNAEEIGADKKTTVEFSIPANTEEGDTLTIAITPKDKDGKEIPASKVEDEIKLTAADIAAGKVTREVPVTPETTKIDATAQVADDAGNESAKATKSVDVDYKTPGDNDGDGVSDEGPKLEIPEATDGKVSPTEYEDGIQAKVTPPKGSEPGDKIIVELKDENGNPVLDAQGNPITAEKEIPADWTEGTPVDVTIPKDALPKGADGKPADATYAPTAKVVDPAGNTSKDSAPVKFDLDNNVNVDTPVVKVGSTDDTPYGADNNEYLVKDEIDANGNIKSVTVGIPTNASADDVIEITIPGESTPRTVTVDNADNAPGNTITLTDVKAPNEDASITVTAVVKRGTDTVSGEGSDTAWVNNAAPTDLKVIIGGYMANTSEPYLGTGSDFVGYDSTYIKDGKVYTYPVETTAAARNTLITDDSGFILLNPEVGGFTGDTVNVTFFLPTDAKVGDKLTYTIYKGTAKNSTALPTDEALSEQTVFLTQTDIDRGYIQEAAVGIYSQKDVFDKDSTDYSAVFVKATFTDLLTNSAELNGVNETTGGADTSKRDGSVALNFAKQPPQAEVVYTSNVTLKVENYAQTTTTVNGKELPFAKEGDASNDESKLHYTVNIDRAFQEATDVKVLIKLADGLTKDDFTLTSAHQGFSFAEDTTTSTSETYMVINLPIAKGFSGDINFDLIAVTDTAKESPEIVAAGIRANLEDTKVGDTAVWKNGMEAGVPVEAVIVDEATYLPPAVTANNNGSVTVLPQETDATSMEIKYIDQATGAEKTLTVEKVTDGAGTADEVAYWKLPADADPAITIDATTGEVTIPAKSVQDGSEVKATETNGTDTSDEGKATALNDPTPPTVTVAVEDNLSDDTAGADDKLTPMSDYKGTVGANGQLLNLTSTVADLPDNASNADVDAANAAAAAELIAKKQAINSLATGLTNDNTPTVKFTLDNALNKDVYDIKFYRSQVVEGEEFNRTEITATESGLEWTHQSDALPETFGTVYRYTAEVTDKETGEVVSTTAQEIYLDTLVESMAVTGAKEGPQAGTISEVTFQVADRSEVGAKIKVTYTDATGTTQTAEGVQLSPTSYKVDFSAAPFNRYAVDGMTVEITDAAGNIKETKAMMMRNLFVTMNEQEGPDPTLKGPGLTSTPASAFNVGVFTDIINTTATSENGFKFSSGNEHLILGLEEYGTRLNTYGTNALGSNGNVSSMTFQNPPDISTGAGDDYIQANGNMQRGSTITTGDGHDKLSFGTADVSAQLYKVDMGAGNDKLLVEGAINAGADFEVDFGEGDDELRVLNNLDGSSKSKFTFGEGDDKMEVGGYVTKKQTFDFGAGNDIVSVKGGFDYATADLGEGNNYFNAGRVGRQAIITAGAGDDVFITKTMHNNGLSGKVTANLGDGNNKVDIGTFGSDAVLTTGAGNDVITIKYGTSGATTNKSQLSTGAGDDIVTFETLGGSVAATGTTVDLGAGNDKIYIGTLQNGATVDGGEGIDTAYLVGQGDVAGDYSIDYFSNVEFFDLTAAGRQNLDISVKMLENTNDTLKIVKILGTSEDTVDLGANNTWEGNNNNVVANLNDNSLVGVGSSGTWAKAKTAVEDGVAYDVYTFTNQRDGISTELVYIQQGVQVI